MRHLRPVLLACSFALLPLFGCSGNHYYAAAPPPPPYAQVPPAVEVGRRNGFETGRADGARDVGSGFAYAPRRTRGFHDTPGYDPRLGPFDAYRNAFRDGYLRGYDRGYHRG